MTRDERWASLLENKRKDMECRHKEYKERGGESDREDKERDLEDQWIIVVDRDHEHVHQNKMRLDPTLSAKIKRRSSECLCEKLK